MRYLLAAFPAVLLLAAACGGDSGDKKAADASSAAGPTVTEAQARQTATAKSLEQPSVADQPLPTPTKVADDGIVLQVIGANAYTPTLAEFKTLPTAEIRVDGQAYSGVTLATLAEKSKAATGVVAGVSKDRPVIIIATNDALPDQRALQDVNRELRLQIRVVDHGSGRCRAPGASGRCRHARRGRRPGR